MSSASSEWTLEKFSYQSRGITFAEWANLFTLCLAPLVAHVFGGVPRTVYLWHKPPRWHERIWQFNPTTILWRYFIIADRRIRAKSWTASDMAASNAYFWTGQGWDGSESMMERSRANCLRLPAHHRVRLFSGSTLTTLIVTIQGVMALKNLIDGVSASSSYGATLSISSIFYPLAFFGLLRLFAAMWLTDDYLYIGNVDGIRLRNATTSSSDVPTPKEEPPLVEVRACTTTGLLDSTDSFSSEKFHRADSWQAIIFRIVYLLPICGLLAICLLYIIPMGFDTEYTLTTLLVILFYASFLIGSLFLFGFYFLSGRTTSSIIPCCNTIWYKLYSCLVMGLMSVLLIFACLQTRATPCGLYTTYPNSPLYDAAICGGIPLGIAAINLTTIGGYIPIENGSADFLSTDQSKSEFVAFAFDGWCKGKILDNGTIANAVASLNSSIIS